MKRFDRIKMLNATKLSKDLVAGAIHRASNVQLDPDKNKRLKEQECLSCFYIYRPRQGVPTTSECGLCGVDVKDGFVQHVLCMNCAKKGNLCHHCGGDMDLKVGRRKWPE